MKPAWRGIVLNDGSIWAWPMLLMDHAQAFAVLPTLKQHRCRWRQWDAGIAVDFDSGASTEDRAAVNAWVERANA